jgi:hypothetical protein
MGSEEHSFGTSRAMMTVTGTLVMRVPSASRREAGEISGVGVIPSELTRASTFAWTRSVVN